MTVRIALSIGDPAGIGPEIVVKALGRLQQEKSSHYQVFAPAGLLSETARKLGQPWPTQNATPVELPLVGEKKVIPGRTDAVSGAVQVESLRMALDAVLAQEADALCTAPITKASARLAGFAFPGHTEYLAHRCGGVRVAMMLAGPGLRVMPLTSHVALKEVAGRLTPEVVAQGLELTALGLLHDFGVNHPRVALAALNPHAGEQGLMGEEEEQLLRPGVTLAQERLATQVPGAELIGPSPADALFAVYQKFDAVVCCYHDQGLIPLKLLCRDRAVNITLGLPLVRTSPAHGSALDIAGQGLAREDSMVAALRLAQDVAQRRQVSSGQGVAK